MDHSYGHSMRQTSNDISEQQMQNQFPGAEIEFVDVASLFPVSVETRSTRAARSGSRQGTYRSRRTDFS